jgi:transglutaminase-like putative cysteine protease
MSWRLEVTHTTGLRYTAPVSVSFNEARMTPADASGQLLIAHELRVSPNARVFSYTDYWGTAVEAFDVHEPHTKLEVVSRNVVDTPGPGFRPDGVSWQILYDANVRDTWCEYLRFSQYVDNPWLDENRAWIVDQMLSQLTPRAATDLAVSHVRARIAYAAGTTSVSTTAREAWAAGSGVCQDFTHATLSLLRAVGVPARYVSGYLYAGSGEIGETSTGESHAWVEAWDGGWWPIDPTNGFDVGEGHTSVARGRDYADVSPLKGVYSGGISEDLGVSVALTRLPR